MGVVNGIIVPTPMATSKGVVTQKMDLMHPFFFPLHQACMQQQATKGSALFLFCVLFFFNYGGLRQKTFYTATACYFIPLEAQQGKIRQILS